MKSLMDISDLISNKTSAHPSIRTSTKTPKKSSHRTSASAPNNQPSSTLRPSIQTDSSATFKENPNIPHSLNTHKLELSLQGIYKEDPLEKLNVIFKTTHFSSVYPKTPQRSHTKNLKNFRRRSKKNDSILGEQEAELIRDELNSIKSPKVWKDLIKTFRQNPVTLLDLIPVKNQSKNRVKHLSQSKPAGKKVEISRPQSLSPVETVTFLEDNTANFRMTEDWHRSLLYTHLKSGFETDLPMTFKEIVVNSKKPPREEASIKAVIDKGIEILNKLLLEMLGTKEDLQRFEERYRVYRPGHARALMEKCLNLINIKRKTEDILTEVILREKILKNLEVSCNNIKEKVIKVYKLNKVIREKIEIWVSDPTVPFEKFIFKEKDYLEKIGEDMIALQMYLGSPYVIYTQS